MKKSADVLTSIKTQFRNIDGLSIRYAESEGSNRKTQALLLSPWPESLFAFEPTWSQLNEHAHLVAVDLPGFGHSEYRESLMSPKAMGEFIVRITDEFEMEQPHMIGPDVGTAASLFAAALHPERFRSLIVGSGGVAFPLVLGGLLKEWIEAPDLEPYRKIGGHAIVKSLIEKRGQYSFSAAARADYLSAYGGERFAESMRYVRAYPTDLPVLRDLLPGIQTPVLIISGKNDMVVPAVNAEFLRDRLPKSKLVSVNSGHYVWEDAADEYAALVVNWWDDEYTAIKCSEQP